MIDHVTIAVSRLSASKLFYEQAFIPLGYRPAFGKEGVFWAFDVGDGLFEIQQVESKTPLTPVHVAFRAKSRAEIVAFHQAALAAGARDNGPPGPRRQYTDGYFACFVLDPDGHNIEAMIDTGAAGSKSA